MSLDDQRHYGKMISGLKEMSSMKKELRCETIKLVFDFDWIGLRSVNGYAGHSSEFEIPYRTLSFIPCGSIDIVSNPSECEALLKYETERIWTNEFLRAAKDDMKCIVWREFPEFVICEQEFSDFTTDWQRSIRTVYKSYGRFHYLDYIPEIYE